MRSQGPAENLSSIANLAKQTTPKACMSRVCFLENPQLFQLCEVKNSQKIKKNFTFLGLSSLSPFLSNEFID